MTPAISVLLPTHNPDGPRLRQTLAALRAQTLPEDRWELILVDNASAPAVDPAAELLPAGARIVREPTLGLSAARRTGARAARGGVVVLVDDDNLLAPDYLDQTLAALERHSRVGALGGRSLPQFETDPAGWMREFFPLLALRDLGPEEKVFLPPAAPEPLRAYPECAPIGAGMALRREALATWLDTPSPLADRTGGELTSAGDNDIVLTLLRAGWGVAYLPALVLMHLIPARRLDARYLCRLNRGIQASWMQVLTRHGINPWPPIARWTVPLRRWKAWLALRAWRDPAARIRWSGACGHFEGRTRHAGVARP